MKPKYFALICLGLTACNEARWGWTGSGLTGPTDLCGLVSSYDALVFGRILGAETRVQEMTFSAWPQHRSKISVLSFEVDRDAKGLIPPRSRVTVLISVPLAPDRMSVKTIDPSPFNVSGWLGLSRMDGHWLTGFDGIVYDKDPGPRHESFVGSFASDEAFEARLNRALVLCPRYDFLADDGGRPDGGYHVWAEEERLAEEARWAEASDAGLFRDAGR